MLVNSCVGVVTTCPFNTFIECGGIPAVVLTSTLEPSEFIFGFTQMMRAHSFKWNCQNRWKKVHSRCVNSYYSSLLCHSDAWVNDSFVFDPLYSHFPDWFQVRFMADHRMYYLFFISSMDTGFIGDATFGWELDGENAWPILVPAILPMRRWEGDEEMQYTR
jgi:hypothetical protein